MTQQGDGPADMTQADGSVDAQELALALLEAQLRGQSRLLATRAAVVADQTARVAAAQRTVVREDDDKPTDTQNLVLEAEAAGRQRHQLEVLRLDMIGRRQALLRQQQQALADLERRILEAEARLEGAAQTLTRQALAVLREAAGEAPLGPAASPQRPPSGGAAVVPLVPLRPPSRTDVAAAGPALQERPVSKRLTERPLFRPAEVRMADDEALGALAGQVRATDTSIQPRTRVVVDAISDAVDARHAPTVGLPGSPVGQPAGQAQAHGGGNPARHAQTQPVTATLRLGDLALTRGQIEFDPVSRTLLVTVSGATPAVAQVLSLSGESASGQALTWQAEVKRVLPTPPRGTLLIIALVGLRAADWVALQDLVASLG